VAQSHILVGAMPPAAQPAIRRITPSDLIDALARGVDDFRAVPTHAVFLCVIYPVVGLVIFQIAIGAGLLSLLYPLATGFALIGPFVAVGLYELSRRREMGLESDWTHVFDVFRSTSFPALATLGGMLLAIFLIWLGFAQSIYTLNFGQAPAASMPDFFSRILSSDAGVRLILIGNGVGFLFAVLVLVISVVSFPLLLDRDVGVATAVLTSVRAVAANPLTMVLWGLIVAVLLVVGSIPFLIGLTVVIPVLAHATWHLYRKVVDPGGSPRPELRPAPAGRRYAADFPAVLLPWSREKRP
jgi:uncharacterized membrane protein